MRNQLEHITHQALGLRPMSALERNMMVFFQSNLQVDLKNTLDLLVLLMLIMLNYSNAWLSTYWTLRVMNLPRCSV